MLTDIRKTLLHVETTWVEGGRAAPRPLKLIAAVAVLTNPWAGRGFVEDLRPEILRVAPPLGAVLTAMIVEAAGSGAAVEAYGKSAVVGLDGEVEHASALIHTLRFGNQYRVAVDGKSFLSFTNKRAGPGTAITIPMMHKDDAGFRAHYLTHEFHIPDAPGADEIVIALGAASSGRPHHRIGDRYQDMEEMQVDQTGKPAQG
jgi:hypothetical protein